VNLNDRSPVTQLQITVSVFHLNYSFNPSYSGRSDGVHFLRIFFLYEFSFRRYKAFKLPNFRNFDHSIGVTNTVARCFSLFSIKQ